MNDIPLSSLPRKSFALPMPHLHEPSPCARHCFAHAQAIALRMRAPLLCACAGHYTAHVHNSQRCHPQGSACPVKTPTYPHQLTTVTRVKPCQTHKWALVPASGSRQEGAPPIYCISCKANTHRFGRAAHCRS